MSLHEGANDAKLLRSSKAVERKRGLDALKALIDDANKVKALAAQGTAKDTGRFTFAYVVRNAKHLMGIEVDNAYKKKKVPRTIEAKAAFLR